MEEAFDKAMALIDEANAADPRTEEVDGATVPTELAYGKRMTDMLARIRPEASEALRLAVRAQHIRRWEIPRSDYPEGRRGYRDWRTTLGRFHGEKAAAILEEAGYDGTTAARVASLIRKEDFRHDEEAQALEDTACLVFLQHYLADFSEKHDEKKILNIMRKTWRKMSPAAQDFAGTLSLSPPMASLVSKALGTGGQ